MDRAPLPPPFPIGTRVRYIGKHEAWTVADDGTKLPFTEPGLVVTIVDTHPGRRGSLRPVLDEDGVPDVDDDGKAVLYRTMDGWSTYQVAHAGKVYARRAIRAENAHEWEITP